MALLIRQLSASLAQVEKKIATRTALRSFSTEEKKNELDFDDETNEKLKQRQLELKNRSVIPTHASKDALALDKAPSIENLSEMAAISGTAEWSEGRHVIISKPDKHAMQSGIQNTLRWEIEFKTNSRWENPLMGWSSGDDPMSNMRLKFDTLDEAIYFAEKQGWKFHVQESPEPMNYDGEKSYSYNFLPENITNRLKKEGTKAKTIFEHPTGRKSTFIKTLKYHGNGVVAQHGGEAKSD